jgi:hypothetical protein
LSVALGNGDGTFQAFNSYNVGLTTGLVLLAGDFNGDGIVDLVDEDLEGGIGVLLGKGDGTFQPWLQFFNGSGELIIYTALGDFNGDGFTDILTSDVTGGIFLWLGAGDGSFQASEVIPDGLFIDRAIAVADFNNDGRLDLAFTENSANDVVVMLGIGDGTFQYVTSLGTGTNPIGISAVDFNGDGNADLAIANGSGNISILLGNGDGTLQFLASPGSTLGAGAFAVGDFNRDGRTDLAVLHNKVTVLLGSIGTMPQIINFGNPGNVSLNTPPFSLLASVTSGLNINFTSNTPGVCTVSFGVVTLLASGGCSITASQPGDATFATAPSVTVNFTVLFNDVAASAYYANGVDLFAQYGITAGCGNNNFCPDQNVTRAQMAIFIIKAIFGNNTFAFSTTPHFADVQPTDFGFKFIQAMFELGISAGCGNGNYCPNDPVTRGSMAVFIVAARLGAGANFTYPATPYFTDVPATANTFKFVQRMRMEGITGGCTPTTFCPAASVTRGQMAIFIMAGLFNQLLPSGTPMITQISPATLGVGTSGTFTITGAATSFVQGTTTLRPIPGVTVGTITVNSTTSLTVQLTAASNAAPQPRSIVAVTGTEEDVLPNGLIVQ